jgi:hypothetical protein
MPFDTSHLSNPSGADYRETYAYLCGMLPPLPAGTTPDDGAVRDRSAMDEVVALVPMDAFEAKLAARIVGMGAYAGHCLHEAGRFVNDPPEMRRCLAMAASMARQSDAALRSLRRMQAERDKALAKMHPAAMERAGYWFKETTVPAAPEPAASPPPEPEPEPQPDIAAEAQRYAVIYPVRAARIRAAGGLPPDLDFGPPEPALVAELLRTGDFSSQATHAQNAKQ